MISEEAKAEKSLVKRFLTMVIDHPMLVLTGIVIVMPAFSLFAWTTVTHVLILGLLAMAFNLLSGETGLLSFGHGLFFGVGAYTTTMSMVWIVPSLYPLTVAYMPQWFAWIAIFLVGPLAATAVAIPTGILNLRRSGTYFALITLAWSMLFYWFVLSDPYNITGGYDGLTGAVTPPIFGLGDNWRTPVTWYYFCAAIVLGAIYVLRRITTSPFGETLRAIRDNEQRVILLGYNPQRFKLISLIISAFFSGLAGSLYAVDISHVDPFAAHWLLSTQPIVMTLLGGRDVFLGPLLGAYVFVFVKDWVVITTKHWQIFIGAAIMAIIAGARGLGILSILRRLVSRLK